MAGVDAGKRALEMTLARVEVPLRKAVLETTHMLTAALVWPRVGIARRASQQEVRLRHGVCDRGGAPWHERVLFKEQCEGSFALEVSLTVSLLRRQLMEWRRLALGYALKSAGEYIDNAGPVVGEAMEVPFKVASKQLLSSKDPELLAQGAVDLQVEAVPLDGSALRVEVPLLSALELMKVQRRYLKIPVVGKAVVEVRALK